MLLLQHSSTISTNHILLSVVHLVPSLIASGSYTGRHSKQLIPIQFLWPDMMFYLLSVTALAAEVSSSTLLLPVELFHTSGPLLIPTHFYLKGHPTCMQLRRWQGLYKYHGSCFFSLSVLFLGTMYLICFLCVAISLAQCSASTVCHDISSPERSWSTQSPPFHS